MLRVATMSSISFTCLPGSEAVARTKSRPGYTSSRRSTVSFAWKFIPPAQPWVAAGIDTPTTLTACPSANAALLTAVASAAAINVCEYFIVCSSLEALAYGLTCSLMFALQDHSENDDDPLDRTVQIGRDKVGQI